MAYSLIETPEMANWWKCCNENSNGEKCGREVGPKWGGVCPECAHQKCDACEAIQQPTHPIVQQYFYQNNGDPQQQNYLNDQGGSSFSSAYQDTPVACGGRPSFAGWWKCCNCNREVNSALCGWSCPDCGHAFGQYCCTTY